MAEIVKGENGYSLKRNKNNEWHIFPLNIHTKGCKPLSKESICTLMDRGEVEEQIVCLTEQEAREACFLKKRDVCGTCVSHLYKTLSDEEKENINL